MTIRVVDRQGLPLGGVSLKHRLGKRVGTTGADGTLELNYVTRLDLAFIFPIFAEKRGYLSSTAPLPKPGVTGVTLEMAEETQNLFVTVLDAARVPTPSACVVLTRKAAPVPSPNQTIEQSAEQMKFTNLLTDATRDVLAMTTDDAGVAAFSTPPRNCTLLVYAAGHLRHEERLDLEKPGALPQHLTITLAAGRSMRGQVVDDQTGLPVSHARIWYPASKCDLVTTDDRGEFTAVVSEEPLNQPLRIFHAEYIPLLAEQSGYAVFRLKRGLVARLRFVDEEGRPIPSPIALHGMAASVGDFSDARWGYIRDVALGSNGDANIGGIDPAVVHELFCSARGFDRASILVDPTSPMFNGERTVVTLPREVICRVTVLDALGQRVAGGQAEYTTVRLVEGKEWRTSEIALIEEESGVFLLPSYLASADTEIEILARRGVAYAVQIVKERGRPFPTEATLSIKSP
jgi:hypothetical protein